MVAVVAVGVATAAITIVAASAHGLGTRTADVRAEPRRGTAAQVHPSASSSTATGAYVRSVTKICSGALLFEASHQLGTREDALAVARDIRASTRRRLDRVRAVPVPRGREGLVERWLALEQRLADLYAESWVGIFDAIDAAHTPGQRDRLPARLRRLLDAPDGLRAAASRIELVLQIPDCTGGEVSGASSSSGR